MAAVIIGAELLSTPVGGTEAELERRLRRLKSSELVKSSSVELGMAVSGTVGARVVEFGLKMVELAVPTGPPDGTDTLEEIGPGAINSSPPVVEVIEALPAIVKFWPTDRAGVVGRMV